MKFNTLHNFNALSQEQQPYTQVMHVHAFIHRNTWTEPIQSDYLFLLLLTQILRSEIFSIEFPFSMELMIFYFRHPTNVTWNGFPTLFSEFIFSLFSHSPRKLQSIWNDVATILHRYAPLDQKISIEFFINSIHTHTYTLSVNVNVVCVYVCGIYFDLKLYVSITFIVDCTCIYFSINSKKKKKKYVWYLFSIN